MTWEEICADPVVAALPYRVESDEWGNILMSPSPGMNHSRQQSKIIRLLDRLMRSGEALSEFPLQTSKGVKGIDAVWISRRKLARQDANATVASIAPEICVEVISPANQRGEIEEKIVLYFERGALGMLDMRRRGENEFFQSGGVDFAFRNLPKISQ